jgi:hypothetical protein
MSETGEIILALCLLVATYVLTRKVQAWRIRGAYAFIIKDLRKKEALDPDSAVNLPYAKPGIFRMGVRDYRPKALEYLTISNVVGMTDDNRYYLKNKEVRLPGE